MCFKWLKEDGTGLIALAFIFGMQTQIPVLAGGDNIEIGGMD